MIRVLIVDDSAVLRQQIRLILESDPTLAVIGEARNGEEAIAQTKQLHPNVITMDIRMPKMDGFEAIRHIMADCPVPIVVVTGDDFDRDAAIASQAIKLGAVSILHKPGSLNDPSHKLVANKLIEQVKIMSEVKVISRARLGYAPMGEAKSTPPAATIRPSSARIELIAIGSSTGGPAALYKILGGLSAECRVPIVIVQHISFGFVGGLVSWLAGGCKLPVKVGKHGERLEPGCIYVAPDDCHMVVDTYGRMRLRQSEAVGGHRPSVTVLFESVAESYGPAAMGVILTGMGADGARGMKAMSNAGAVTLAQDEQSCVVFGMPKEAIALGAVRHVLPLNKIASTMMEYTIVRQTMG